VEFERGNCSPGATALEQPLQLLNVNVMAAQIDRDRHGKWNESGVTAGEKQDDEFGIRPRDQCHALSAFQPELQQLLRGGTGALPEFTVGQCRAELSFRVVEVATGYALRGIFQCLGERLKVGESLWLAVICPSCLLIHRSFSPVCFPNVPQVSRDPDWRHSKKTSGPGAGCHLACIPWPVQKPSLRAEESPFARPPETPPCARS